MIDSFVLEQENEVCYNTRKSRLYQEQLGLSDAFFEHCRQRIGNNVSYFTPDEDCDTYDKKWKLCVPKAIVGLKS